MVGFHTLSLSLYAFLQIDCEFMFAGLGFFRGFDETPGDGPGCNVDCFVLFCLGWQRPEAIRRGSGAQEQARQTLGGKGDDSSPARRRTWLPSSDPSPAHTAICGKSGWRSSTRDSGRIAPCRQPKRESVGLFVEKQGARLWPRKCHVLR